MKIFSESNHLGTLHLEFLLIWYNKNDENRKYLENLINIFRAL